MIEFAVVAVILGGIALAVAAAAYAKKHPEDPRVVAFEARIQGLESRLHLTALHTPAPSAVVIAPAPAESPEVLAARDVLKQALSPFPPHPSAEQVAAANEVLAKAKG